MRFLELYLLFVLLYHALITWAVEKKNASHPRIQFGEVIAVRRTLSKPEMRRAFEPTRIPTVPPVSTPSPTRNPTGRLPVHRHPSPFSMDVPVSVRARAIENYMRFGVNTPISFHRAPSANCSLVVAIRRE